jgi:hypothetical protein
MSQPKVLLVVDDGALRARYEMVLRFCGYRPVVTSSRDPLDHPQKGIIAACVLMDHGAARDALCARLLGWAIPVVKIDPFIRHAREHLPFDVVLPATSEPRELITALRHLMPHGAQLS